MKEVKLKHNCGLCVAHTLHDAYSFIKSLQHRGREAAGIAFIGNGSIDVIKWQGKVERFGIEDLYKIFPSTKYHTYMAHIRYATRGRKDKILEDAHPHVIGGKIDNRGDHIIITDCEVVGVHNGQVNPEFFKSVDKSLLKTECDTEAMLHFYLENNERGILKRIPGSYVLAIASKRRKEVIVLRDKTGLKPASLGWKDGKYSVASEDISFKKNGGKFIEDLSPGCIYYLSPDGSYEKVRVAAPEIKHCFFEYNYIADIDTVMNGVSVRRVREILGETLAKEFQPKADLVTYLPRCPEVAARSYAEKRVLPFENIFYKPRDERAFLGSTSEDRKKSISENLHIMPKIQDIPAKEFLRDKEVIVIDDSTIRGNNSRRAIELLKNAGVKKIYLLNYTPKIGIIGEDNIPRGCLYGVDMPPEDNFIARNRTNEEIGEILGVEIYFMSVEGLLKSFEKAGLSPSSLCTFCIGGQKPFDNNALTQNILQNYIEKDN